MQYSRKMGLDYGDKRIGIAFTDLLCMIVTPYETFKNEEEEKTLAYLAKLAKDKQVSQIVIGLPLNMDGSEGERTILTREFGEKLSKISSLPVDYIDERLTSLEADEVLKRQGVKSWEKRKEMLDMISAQIILQNYLDCKK